MPFKTDKQRKYVMALLGPGYRSRKIRDDFFEPRVEAGFTAAEREVAFTNYAKHGFETASAHEVIRHRLRDNPEVLNSRGVVGEFWIQKRGRRKPPARGVTLFGVERHNRFDMGADYNVHDLVAAIKEGFRRRRTRSIIVVPVTRPLSPYYVVRKFKKKM